MWRGSLGSPALEQQKRKVRKGLGSSLGVLAEFGLALPSPTLSCSFPARGAGPGASSRIPGTHWRSCSRTQHADGHLKPQDHQAFLVGLLDLMEQVSIAGTPIPYFTLLTHAAGRAREEWVRVGAWPVTSTPPAPTLTARLLS